jgi:acylphosphatase
VVEGPPSALDRLEEALRIGPAGAVVEQVAAVRMPGTGRFDGFSIRSGSHPGD